jgi:hypothetical protein
MRVLFSLKASPLGANHSANLALTCSASCLEWQQTARSSAYLTRTGVPGIDSAEGIFGARHLWEWHQRARSRSAPEIACGIRDGELRTDIRGDALFETYSA